MTLKTKYTQLFSQLTTQSIILTPNRRLSATLHQLYQQHQLEKHETAWPTPDILPLSSFLERLWTQQISHSSLSLLNIVQEQCLWEKIISESKEASSLLQITETAEIARSARILLKAWRIDLSLPDFLQANEYMILTQWIADFEGNIEKQLFIDQASLPDYLASQILEKNILTYHHLFLLGFNEISPQLNYFLSCCKERNNIISIFSLEETPQNSLRVSYKTEEEEILHIARLCQNIHEKNPAATIGCVFPSLDKKRDRVSQLFSQVFANNNKLNADENNLPFNISAGKPLTHYPIIQFAIQLLSLHKKTLPISIMSYLLASPFLGEAETEKFKRASLDIVLRKENLHQIDLTHSPFIQLYCPLLAKRLTAFFTALPSSQQILSYSDWAKKFAELLTLCGFPGERSLNSHEYQMIEQFLNLLTALTALNQIFGKVNYNHALNTFIKIAAKHIFQFKTPETSIQVLGLLEAASLPFDYLFVAEMHDMSWPAKPNPNPLIPKSLQRRLQMPHASFERELIYCESLTNLFKQSAAQVIFSHAEKKEELELTASPLIRDIEEISYNTLLADSYQSTHEKIYLLKNFEQVIDNQAAMIAAHEKIQGGTEIFKRQALCPFKAFAESRLHAKAIETPIIGLRPKDRGILLHKTLEHIWKQIKDHQTLMTLNNDHLQDYIQSSIETAFNSITSHPKKNSRYYELEKKRLYQLACDWLNIEKNRPPFKVLEHEKIETIQFQQLSFSLRIDRIDEINNGKKLIIDYKMGTNQSINDWFGERPLSPQLPLYASIDPEQTIGITFAQIQTGKSGFKGISQYSLDIQGIKSLEEIHPTNWPQQISSWKDILSQLSQDFYFGKAEVNPKDTTACHWCDLKTFCRIEEMTHEYRQE